MKKPILIIMAAGLGSRYGGLKQIDPVDKEGHIMMDYSLYDARQAGFEKVIFIISPKIEKDFKEAVGNRISQHMDVHYAFQTLDQLPEGFTVPEGRVKPWGTSHAVLSAKSLVDQPFAVLNADDYYGPDAFRSMYHFLCNKADARHHAMIGYRLENTLTDNGHVARGVCSADSAGNLTEIAERTHIEARPGGGAYTEDGENFHFLPGDTLVSMNFWGFGLPMMAEIETRFAGFLEENLPTNPLKCEFFIPLVVNALLQEQKAGFQVLPTPDKWYGVTYSEDMPYVHAAIEQMKQGGTYPRNLWGSTI